MNINTDNIRMYIRQYIYIDKQNHNERTTGGL